jgi:hypothetical protein
MSWANAATTIRTRWKTLIEEGLGLPTEFPNRKIKPPEGKLWCKVSILEGEDVRQSVVPKRFRTPGVVICQIFDTPGKGDTEARQMADAIKAEFRAVTVSGVKFKTASIKVLGIQGPYFQINVSITFHVDDTA